MRLLKPILFGLASLAMLASCSSDEPGQPNKPDEPIAGGDNVYMALDIKMPQNGGRSQTVEPGQSSDGIEVGTDAENKVQSVAIVLAKSTDNSFIACGTVAAEKLTPVGTDNSYKTVAKLNKTQLNTYYSKPDFTRTVNVFVFCNPTTELNNVLSAADLGDKTWYDAICNVTETGGNATNSIWAANGFVMSNFEIATRDLPANMDDWNNYKTEATAFDLSGINAAGLGNQVDNSSTNGRGSVKVQRLAARIDFKDGSTLGNNTYEVLLNAANKALFNVKLYKIALANMAKQCYYLPRVSDNGQLAGSTLCGAETNTNYIVGPYAAKFNASLTTGFDTYFNYPLFNTSGNADYQLWYAANISAVLGGNPDNYKDKEYKVWRYLTENVIPAEPSNQELGKTTTAVFKGKIVATQTALESQDESVKHMAEVINGQGLTGNPDNDPILYSFGRSLYLTWPEVQKAAIKASVPMVDNVPSHEVEGEGENIKYYLTNINRSNPLYVAVYGNGGMGTITWGNTTYIDRLAQNANSANSKWTAWNADKTAENLAAMRAAVTGANFTIYQSSIDNEGEAGYYCFYYYKIRHNDNGKPGAMGPMEFSIVRNNVYKLAVTKISQLGHPRIPENDPDKPKPDEPDENDDIYLTVSCRVLPWIVRVNNIEF